MARDARHSLGGGGPNQSINPAPNTPVSIVVSEATSQEPPSPQELDALLRLLDDETPEVRNQVAQRLALCGGDISEWLSAQNISLSDKEKSILSSLLGKGRRKQLEQDWFVPTDGTRALREDWDLFESLLRAISDFLHDGITFRQPLSDALDLLAEEAEREGVTSADDLRCFLFEGTLFEANHDGYEDPRNSDIAWSIAEGKSNPIGLSIIFCMVARRMGLVVEPISFPAHFLCRIFENGEALIVDCFNHGATHPQSSLLNNTDLTRAERNVLKQTADPGSILLRVLNNLTQALLKAGRADDAALVRKLRITLDDEA